MMETNELPPANVRAPHTHAMNFTVSFDFPVHFERGIFRPDCDILADVLNRKGENRRFRCLVVVDDAVARHNPDLIPSIKTWFAARPETTELVKEPLLLPGGEAIKNDYRKLMEVVDTMLEYKMCRQSFVIVIGGGGLLDAVGFATALVHRGLRLIRMPTTVLAQNDAGVGVKNAMNLHGGKNTVGTFAPPWAVINDFALLDSLSDTDWRGGISEAFKVALIKDADFFHRLCADAPKYAARDKEAMEYLIIRCAQLHLHHIATNGDPFEYGTARPLDFGHWAAHKMESMSNYGIPHGQAVAVGVAMDSYYAMRKTWITEADYEAIVTGLHQSGLPLWYDILDRTLGDGTLEVVGGLADFQEHLGGELTVTFPDGIGAKQEKHEVDAETVAAAIADLKRRFAPVTG